MGVENQNYLCNLIYPLWEHPAVVWIARPDMFADHLQTPQGAVQNDNGIFRIGMWGPGAALVVIEDDASIARPGPQTVYEVLMPPGGQLSIEINDPTPANPQIPTGNILSTVQGQTLQLYCDRPVQLNVVGLDAEPIVVPPPPPPPPPGPMVLADLTNVLWNNWYSVGIAAQAPWGQPGGYPLPTSGHVDYVTYPASLAGATAIRVKFRVTGNNAVTHADPADIQPCKLSLFFGTFDLITRFWTHSTPLDQLTPGEHEYTQPLTESVWYNVNGQHDPSFEAAKQNPLISVGFTLGGQFFDGHGVYSADGSNALEILSYQILGPPPAALTIQQMIDQALPGSAVTVSAGTYDIDAVNAPLKLKSGITLDLRAGAILRTIPNAAVFSLTMQAVGVQNVTILGGTLEGDRYAHLGPTDPGAGGGGGLLGIGEGASEIMVIGTRIQHSFCDGVLIRDGKHIELNAVTCDLNRRQGVTIINSDTVYIHDSQFSNNGGTPPGDGVDIENDLGTETVANVLITRNIFYGNEGSPVGVGGPGEYTNINVMGNTNINVTA